MVDDFARARRGATVRRRRRWPWFAAGIVLALLAAAGAAAFWLLAPIRPVSVLLADHHTKVGERVTVLFSDLSTADMAPGSSLSKQFDAEIRRVTLHHGEAYFTVKPDRERIFVVVAGDGETTVAGTEFNVKLVGGEVEVTVAEGAVDVAASGATTVRVMRQRRVRYGGRRIGEAHEVAPNDLGDWRRNWVRYDAVPLGDVVSQLERYRPGRIVLWDDGLAALPVSGNYDFRKPDKVLDQIAKSLSLRLERLHGYLVLVRAPE